VKFDVLDLLKPVLGTLVSGLDLDELTKIKVLDADFELDEETNTMYAQVRVDSKESLAALRRFAEKGLEMLKEVNSKDA
jgi:hypothetical protein